MTVWKVDSGGSDNYTNYRIPIGIRLEATLASQAPQPIPNFCEEDRCGKFAARAQTLTEIIDLLGG